MAWDIERRGRRSMLIGAAHFFPRHFRRDLRRLIGPARVVLLEGPLDEAATKKVIEAGQGTGGERLYHAAKEAVRARLGIVPLPLDVHQILKDLVFGRQEEWLEAELRKLKPWAAFFGIWTRWRAREGWEQKMDLDAAAIAAKLGKPVRHLETIEEQIGALEAVPFERYVRFLASADWSGYNESYERHYLAGDVEGLAAAAQDFPTYCEPVIARRDPVLASRMLGELARGDACVVLGVAHCRGVLAAIKAEGYAVRQLSSGCS